MSRPKKMQYGIKLLIAMTVYAFLFVALVVFGLSKFWDFIAAYEASRPQNTINAYMEQLEVSHMQDSAAELIASIDHNIQSEEACRQKIADALSGGVTYARKRSDCTDTQLVYMLMSGGKTVGKFTLTAQDADAFGFTRWTVTAESFDFSFLIGEGTTVTVPHDYPVYVNGTQLSSEYITQTDIPYTLIGEFYESHQLPYMVTYKVAPILGNLDVTITDPHGNTVTAEDALNEALVLNNSSAEEISKLDTLISDYLSSYVRFSTNANKDLQGNYQKLLTYIVPDSALAERMKDALGGLKWVRDRQATISSLDIHHRIRFLDGYYMCDVTYVVETNDYNTVNHTTENVRIIFKQTDNGLKEERMIGY